MTRPSFRTSPHLPEVDDLARQVARVLAADHPVALRTAAQLIALEPKNERDHELHGLILAALACADLGQSTHAEAFAYVRSLPAVKFS